MLKDFSDCWDVQLLNFPHRYSISTNSVSMSFTILPSSLEIKKLIIHLINIDSLIGGIFQDKLLLLHLIK
jgi:hypothetical protein